VLVQRGTGPRAPKDGRVFVRAGRLDDGLLNNAALCLYDSPKSLGFDPKREMVQSILEMCHEGVFTCNYDCISLRVLQDAKQGVVSDMLLKISTILTIVVSCPALCDVFHSYRLLHFVLSSGILVAMVGSCTTPSPLRAALSIRANSIAKISFSTALRCCCRRWLGHNRCRKGWSGIGSWRNRVAFEGRVRQLYINHIQQRRREILHDISREFPNDESVQVIIHDILRLVANGLLVIISDQAATSTGTKVGILCLARFMTLSRHGTELAHDIVVQRSAFIRLPVDGIRAAMSLIQSRGLSERASIKGKANVDAIGTGTGREPVAYAIVDG
jgi:hypothetical protein